MARGNRAAGAAAGRRRAPSPARGRGSRRPRAGGSARGLDPPPGRRGRPPGPGVDPRLAGRGAPRSRRRSTTTACCATGVAGSRCRRSERALAAALIDRFNAVVGRDTLVRRAWPGGSPTRNALDVHMLRLRRRISTLGPRGPHRARPWVPPPGARAQRRREPSPDLSAVAAPAPPSVASRAMQRASRASTPVARSPTSSPTTARIAQGAVDPGGSVACGASTPVGPRAPSRSRARPRHHGGDERAARAAPGPRRAGDDAGVRRRDRDRAGRRARRSTTRTSTVRRRWCRVSSGSRCAGRLDAHGRELEPFDGVVPDVRRTSTRSRCACSTPTSTRRHERAVAAVLRGRGIDVVCSHEVSPEFREYERMVTTAADAALRAGVRAVPRRAWRRSPTRCR